MKQYKVISHHEGYPFKIGDILTIEFQFAEICGYRINDEEDLVQGSSLKFDEHPDVFELINP